MQGEIVWRTCPKCGVLVRVENERCECGYCFHRRMDGRSRFAPSVIVCLCVLLAVSVGANAWLFWCSRSDANLYKEQLAEAQEAGYRDGWDSAAWSAFYDGYAVGFDTAYPEIEEPGAGTVSAQRRAAMLQHYAEIKAAFLDWEEENR